MRTRPVVRPVNVDIHFTHRVNGVPDTAWNIRLDDIVPVIGHRVVFEADGDPDRRAHRHPFGARRCPRMGVDRERHRQLAVGRGWDHQLTRCQCIPTLLPRRALIGFCSDSRSGGSVEPFSSRPCTSPSTLRSVGPRPLGSRTRRSRRRIYPCSSSPPSGLECTYPHPVPPISLR